MAIRTVQNFFQKHNARTTVTIISIHSRLKIFLVGLRMLFCYFGFQKFSFLPKRSCPLSDAAFGLLFFLSPTWCFVNVLVFCFFQTHEPHTQLEFMTSDAIGQQQKCVFFLQIMVWKCSQQNIIKNWSAHRLWFEAVDANFMAPHQKSK